MNTPNQDPVFVTFVLYAMLVVIVGVIVVTILNAMSKPPVLMGVM